MRSSAFVLCILVGPAAALAGCLGGPAADDAPAAEVAASDAPAFDGPLPEPVLVVEDAQGDARLYSSEFAKAQSARICQAAGTRAGGPCNTARNTVNGQTPPGTGAVGGTPAPPALDVLDVTFSETPETFVVEARVGEVAADFSHVKDGDLVETSVCWTTSDVRCEERVYVWGERTGGTLVTQAAYLVVHPDCNIAWSCSWGVPFEIADGAPGVVRWTIPRSVMPNATLGDRITEPFAYSVTMVRPMDERVRYGATSAAGSESGSLNYWQAYNPDSTENGTEFEFRTSLRDAALGEPVIVDPPGDLRNGVERPDMDILSARVVENETHLGISTELAEVSGEPVPGEESHLQLSTLLRLSNGASVLGGYNVRDGAWNAYAVRCGDRACQKAGEIPASLTFAPGSPGHVNISYERASLGSPAAGTLITVLDVTTTWYDGRREGDDPIIYQVEYYVTQDFTPEVPPSALAIGAPRENEAGTAAVEVSDPVGDLNLEIGEGVPRNRFDVTFARIEATGPATTRVSLGILALDQTTPPITYDAILYAVGLETADGAFVIGYYHDSEGLQEFFCGQDTVVFADQRVNPRDGVVTPINGAISLGQAADSDAEVSGGRTGASIAFDVPHACFARTTPGDFQATRMAGATFLLRNPLGRSGTAIVSDPVDEALLDTPFLVQYVAPPAPPLPWHVAPFGIENFWDITGVLAAVAVSGGGLLAIERRRTRLRRWLARVDDAVASTKDDARAREGALVGLRARLREELVRGRMSDGHYAIVERRIDEELAKARVASIGEAFRELPYWLVTKLQGLLADGVMTKDDVRVFSAAVAETSLPEAAKAEIRERLERWATQDRAATGAR